MKTLRLGKSFALPLEALTQTFGILAKRRAGKSYTARRLAEQFHKTGQQIVITDPKGDWWGVRSSADGKSPGLPIVILGGERGDVKLETGAGEVVAKLVVEEQVSALLDLSLFRKNEVATFMTAFLESLYRLKAREEFRTPMMLIVDEADAIAPQKPFKGEERMLGAAEDIVRRGGQRGIGCTMITQRSAVLNKNLLTQIQVLVAMRTIAPQDLAALDAWVDVHGTEAERKTLMESLPALPTGHAWFWSPGWPTPEGVFQLVEVLPIETFDSGATPKPGEKRVEPKNLADVDLEALSRQMAATIERAKADDPRELRKQIAALKAELGKKQQSVEKKQQYVEPKRVEVLTDADRTRLEKVQQTLKQAIAEYRDGSTRLLVRVKEEIEQQLGGFINAARSELQALNDEIATLLERPSVQKLLEKIAAARTPAPEISPPRHILSAPLKIHRPSPRPVAPARVAAPSGEFVVKDMHRRMLTALAEHPNGLTKRQILIITTYASSGPVSTAFADLAREGLVVSTGNLLQITDVGVAALGDYEPLPAGEALYQHLMNGGKLSTMEKALLGAVHETYPEAIRKGDILERTGYASSGPVSVAFARLVAFGYVRSSGPSLLKAADELFD